MLKHLIPAICVGLFAGGAARLFVAPPHPLGCLGTALLGMVGSVLGGLVCYPILRGEEYRPANFFVSVICAATLLWFARQHALKKQ
jgi:uncharacterized membrane protein YeaQ/YmgE (transglycosylase-associated protein family)